MKVMADLISEISRLSIKCNKLESETDQIKQEIRNRLRDIRNLPCDDNDTLSVGLVRNILENLLEEGSELNDEVTPQTLT